MARREWARKLIDKQPMARGGDSVDGNAAIKLLKPEHARAVQIVKRELRLMASHILNDEQAGNEDGLAIHRYAASVLTDLLTALQRGRGGKG